jgi:hypothetical protein
MTGIIGVIGGTGLGDVIDGGSSQRMPTPYGVTEVAVGVLGSRDVAFVARHGAGHTVPPHRIDLAALAVSAGPMVGASVAVAIPGIGRLGGLSGGERVVVVLVPAAALTIAAADLSQMSKAEVERIWLPFVPWLLLGTALLSDRWRRAGFAAQLVFALAVQHLLFTGW